MSTKTQHIPLHPHQPGQARFLCRDSDFLCQCKAESEGCSFITIFLEMTLKTRRSLLTIMFIPNNPFFIVLNSV